MQKTAAASCRRKMAGMPHMNFFFWVLCRMHRMVTYMAAEPPRADRVRRVASGTLHLCRRRGICPRW